MEKSDLTLEEIVHLANRVGLEYVAAKRQFDSCDLRRSAVRARIMERYDDGSRSESKIRRLAEMDEEYSQFLSEFLDAKEAAERLRIRYESYKNLFEAKRSMLSYQKAEMRIL